MILPFVIFTVFVLAMLALDLGVFHRKSEKVSVKEAAVWSVIWISLALLFNALIWFKPGIFFSPGDLQAAIAQGDLAGGAAMADLGALRGKEFLAGYLLEKSLSVDNIFVFILLFTAFRIPEAYQHKVLFWGVLGAIVMRALFIAAGVTLISNFHFLIYIFGAFLVYTGVKMVLSHGNSSDPKESRIYRFLSKRMRVTPELEGDKFWVVKDGQRWFTPLFITLILIEITDLVFAVDSIPAILAITDNAFIVYTSNIFAILGLRSLYFALVGAIARFHLLHYGLAAILVFVGVKMLIIDLTKIPIGISLAFIGSTLLITVVLSLVIKPRKAMKP